MMENRAYREEQYRTRREKDYEEALEREAELSASLKAQFEAQAALETQRWREAEAAHKQVQSGLYLFTSGLDYYFVFSVVISRARGEQKRKQGTFHTNGGRCRGARSHGNKP